MFMCVLDDLEGKIMNNKNYSFSKISEEYLGLFLCGVNYELAENPFSKEFLENVAYNSKDSFHAVLWLQLNYREKNKNAIVIC
jgi:ribosomal protein S8